MTGLGTREGDEREGFFFPPLHHHEMASRTGDLADVESYFCLLPTSVDSAVASLLGPLAATPLTQTGPHIPTAAG